MFGESQGMLRQKGLKLVDLLLTWLAFGLAFMGRGLTFEFSAVAHDGAVSYLMVLLATTVCLAITYDFFDLYGAERNTTLVRQAKQIVKAVLVGSALAVFLFYIFKQEGVSRLFFASFMILDSMLLGGSRLVLAWLRRLRVQTSLGHRHVLVVGSRERAKDMLRLICPNEELGYQVVGCLEIDADPVGQEVVEGVQVIGTMKDFRDVVLARAIDEVVFAMPLRLIEDVREQIGFAEQVGVNVRVLPDWQVQQLAFQPEVASVFVEKFAGIPTLAFSSVPRKEFALFLKGLCDRTVAACGLLTLLPLFALLAAIIKATSKGPVFFRQERSGLSGRIFTLYKFRTMVANAEEIKARLAEANEMDGPVFKMKNDPRITGIGGVLRKTSLDELPQLINVLKGEMSLVGPRPPLPSEVADYQPWQRRRLSMKPGLTCIWQVSGRNNISFERWMKMDLEYIDRWSLSLDAKLLAKTLPAVVFGTGH